MGYSISRTKEGMICAKCRKLLVPWDDVQSYRAQLAHQDKINTLSALYEKEWNQQIGWYWIWDPSEGTSSGWWYDSFCMDCFRPSWIRTYSNNRHPAAPKRVYGAKDKQ